MPRVENGIVVYDQFRILKKLEHCSLVEYISIHGVKKTAIILNGINQIIYPISNNNYLLTFYNYSILESQNEIMNCDFKDPKIIKLVGDYQLSENEYLLNFPYTLELVKSNGDLSYNIYHDKQVDIDFIRRIPFEVKKNSVAYKEVTKGELNLKFYKYYELLDFASKFRDLSIPEKSRVTLTRNNKIVAKSNDNTGVKITKTKKKNGRMDADKRNYYLETYKILMENYYKEKELREKNKKQKHQLDVLKRKEKQKKRKTKDKRNSNVRPGENTGIITEETSNKSSWVENEHKPDASSRINNDYIKENISKDEIAVTNDFPVINVLPAPDKGNFQPQKKEISITTTTRNMTIVKYLKTLYQDQCQICGETVEISKEEFVSEVHHIQPLGAHNGADVIQNMIVLCPNHHAMFDRGAITIDLDKKVVLHCNPKNPLHNKVIQLKHEIGRAYIDYYNQNIFLATAKPVNQNNISQVANIPHKSNAQKVDYGNIVTLQDIDTLEEFQVNLEEKYNREFMKPIQKAILGKYLHDIVSYSEFKYKILKIN